MQEIRISKTTMIWILRSSAERSPDSGKSLHRYGLDRCGYRSVARRADEPFSTSVLSYLDPGSGLLVRPKTSFSEPVADLGDQALTLYAFPSGSQSGGDQTEHNPGVALMKLVAPRP